MNKDDRYGRLVVLRVGDVMEDGFRWVDVLCDCGKKTRVRNKNLSYGHTTSCGCYHIEQVKLATTKHGQAAARTVEYEAWRDMNSRCYQPSCDSFTWYGGKGIKVCERWRKSFEHFFVDLGPRPSGKHQLSRKDPAKDFTPANTYWATKHEAGRHRSNNQMHTIGGVTKCLVDWAKEYGIPKSTLHYRLGKGMSMRDALDVGRGTSGLALPV